MKQLIRLKKNNDVIFGHIWDPLEQDLMTDPITLSDGNFQIHINKDKNFKKLFKRKLSDEWNQILFNFKKYEIPLLSFSTLENPATQLRQLINPVKRNT